MRNKNPKPPVQRKIDSLSLEDHIKYWDEARHEKRHYFLRNLDMDVSKINELLIYNSKYFYDVNDISSVKLLYLELCNVLLSVRQNFNYEAIGKFLQFLTSDTRFILKPFDIPRQLGVVRETFILLTTEWDKTILKSFPFAYKTLLSARSEVGQFLLYLTIEGCAHGIVSPRTSLSIGKVLSSFLECLEIPMSLYFDSFHLRKLLLKIGNEGAPAFSLHCLHPILTQMQYIFLNYYSSIEHAMSTIDLLKDLPWKSSGFSYLFQSFLVDNYHQMVYWKPWDYKSSLEEIIKPPISSLIEDNMPPNVLNKLLIQGFYDMVQMDCTFNLVSNLFNFISKEMGNWHFLVQTWNDGIIFNEFRTSSTVCNHAINLLTMFFYVSLENDSVEEAQKCITIISKFVLKRIRTAKHTEIILKYLSIYPWDFQIPLYLQIQGWFNDVIIQEREAGFEDNTIASSTSVMEDDYSPVQII